MGRRLTVTGRRQGPTGGSDSSNGGGDSSNGGSGAGLLPDLAALLPAVFGLPAGGGVEQCNVGCTSPLLCCPLMGRCLICHRARPAQQLLYHRNTHSTPTHPVAATVHALQPAAGLCVRSRRPETFQLNGCCLRELTQTACRLCSETACCVSGAAGCRCTPSKGRIALSYFGPSCLAMCCMMSVQPEGMCSLPSLLQGRAQGLSGSCGRRQGGAAHRWVDGPPTKHSGSQGRVAACKFAARVCCRVARGAGAPRQDPACRGVQLSEHGRETLPRP